MCFNEEFVNSRLVSRIMHVIHSMQVCVTVTNMVTRCCMMVLKKRIQHRSTSVWVSWLRIVSTYVKRIGELVARRSGGMTPLNWLFWTDLQENPCNVQLQIMTLLHTISSTCQNKVGSESSRRGRKASIELERYVTYSTLRAFIVVNHSGSGPVRLLFDKSLRSRYQYSLNSGW